MPTSLDLGHISPEILCKIGSFTKFKEVTVVNSVLPKLEANSQNKMSIPDPQATILKV